MTTLYARFNLQLVQTDTLAQTFADLQQYLHDAALEGFAEDFEIFYYEQEALTGVSIPFSADDLMTLLEAGSVLGYCHRRWEEYGGEVKVEHTWLSLHDAEGAVIDSVLSYPK
jgi:hypothetical protein